MRNALRAWIDRIFGLVRIAFRVQDLPRTIEVCLLIVPLSHNGLDGIELLSHRLSHAIVARFSMNLHSKNQISATMSTSLSVAI